MLLLLTQLSVVLLWKNVYVYPSHKYQVPDSLYYREETKK